ncbi:MAG: toll/interleukin-1 receptor domain-containing protein [Betaproteobacteria bacterium]|jgi:hypothetical protein|nr:toll/interleukin-1 receptor domain-containing protein [Betaproteobacteria bacterium]
MTDPTPPLPLSSTPSPASTDGPETAPAALFDAFISYSHADDDDAQALLRDLKARDIAVWIDAEQIEPGDLFVTVLEAGMKASRNVLLLVSPRSQASAWVTEEYANALNLINGRRDTIQRRLIPVLLGGAAPDGFLASRHQVDLRNPADRGKALDRLAATLRGSRSHARRSAPAAPLIAAPAGEAIDEVQYLTRYIGRMQDETAPLRRARYWSPMVGALFTAPAFWLLGEQASLQLMGTAAGAAVTGLLGWAVTAYSLSATERKASTLRNLRDGIELCRLRTGPMCEVLEQRFWSLVDGASQVSPPGAA